MPIYWKELERLAVVERHGDFYHVRAKHRASGESVLLLILTDPHEAQEQADLWEDLLMLKPEAKMSWDMRLNYLYNPVREDDLRHDADLERDGPQEQE